MRFQEFSFSSELEREVTHSTLRHVIGRVQRFGVYWLKLSSSLAPPAISTKPREHAWQKAIEVLMATLGIVIAWRCVSWALAPGLYLYGDEIGNLARVWSRSYGDILNIFPEWIYNDRPIGFGFLRLL